MKYLNETSVILTTENEQLYTKVGGPTRATFIFKPLFNDELQSSTPLVLDIETITTEGDSAVEDIDLLVMPHPATFNVQSGFQWSECGPEEETKQATLYHL